MKWFGKSWGAPICVETDHVATPVGAKCGYCNEAILDGDVGVVMPMIEGPKATPTHHACLLYSMGVASMTHVLQGGYPICGFTQALPRDWPEGHRWVSIASIDRETHVTCRSCLRRLREVS